MSSTSVEQIDGLSTPDVVARYGVKGTHAAAWLSQQGIAVPEAANRIMRWRGDGGGRCLRLGHHEFLVEHDTTAPPSFTDLSHDGAWLLTRSDASLLLDGPSWPAALTQLCSFDFGRLQADPDMVVMTLAAGIAVTLVREPRPVDQPRIALRLWCDASHGPYLRQCLQQLTFPARADGGQR